MWSIEDFKAMGLIYELWINKQRKQHRIIILEKLPCVIVAMKRLHPQIGNGGFNLYSPLKNLLMTI